MDGHMRQAVRPVQLEIDHMMRVLVAVTFVTFVEAPGAEHEKPTTIWILKPRGGRVVLMAVEHEVDVLRQKASSHIPVG